MLSLTAPNPIDGGLLAEQLAAAGIPSEVVLHGDEVHLMHLGEADLAAVRAVIDGHAAAAQAAIDKASAARGNEALIKQQADTALTTNAAFLDLASPTNVQLAAQVKALTRQNNGLIRLGLRRFEATG